EPLHPLRWTQVETGIVMKPVIQQEATGCGIASVAALSGVSYGAAKRVANRIGISAADSLLWSETAYVRRLLKHYRHHTSSRVLPFVAWDALPKRALLAIKWHRMRGRAYWHWVVFVRDPSKAYVLDSSANLKRHVRTDFGRMKPTWFLIVNHSS